MYIYMYIYMLYTNDITIYACMYIDISDAYKHRASSLPWKHDKTPLDMNWSRVQPNDC